MAECGVRGVPLQFTIDSSAACIYTNISLVSSHAKTCVAALLSSTWHRCFLA